MTNFDQFTKEKDFAAFSEAAVAAERIYQIDPAACVLNCRTADHEGAGSVVPGESVHLLGFCHLLLL